MHIGLRYRIANEKTLSDLAHAIEPLVAKGRVLFLEGGLAAGKTCFARALIQTLCPEEVVPSPTFSLVQPYRTRAGEIVHVDLYRLTRAEQAFELGLEEIVQQSFLMIEWPQRLGRLRRILFDERTCLTLRLKRCETNETRLALLRLPKRLATRELIDLQAPRISSALVFVGGKGTRMRGYSARLPKPLVSVGGQSLLKHALGKLQSHGVERLFVNAHHLAPQIVAHLAERELPRTRVLYEPRLLETGGTLKRALPLFRGMPFFAINGDALWHDGEGEETLLGRLERAWQKLAKRAQILLAVVEEEGARDFCPLKVKKDAGDSPFPLTLPSPRGQSEVCFRYAGLQILTEEAFVNMPYKIFSLKVLYERAALTGSLYGVLWRGSWHHIGDKAALLKARRAWGKVEHGGGG